LPRAVYSFLERQMQEAADFDRPAAIAIRNLEDAGIVVR
jgi:hypothetical protein